MSNNEWKNWTNNKPDVRQVAFWHFASFCTQSYALSYIMFHAIMNNQNTEIAKAHQVVAKHYQAYNSEYFNGYKYALDNPIDKYDSTFDFEQWLATKDKYLQHFQHNLTQMVQYAQRRNVKVVLLTMPINYKLAPSWASPQPLCTQPQHEAKIQSILREANNSIENKAWAKADSLVKYALTIEPRSSIIHYMKAYVMENLAQPDIALQHYTLSREYMVGDLGSIESVNSCIRSCGRATNVDVIDIKAMFDTHSKELKSYYNQQLIDDDCHPNQLGHMIIANALSDYFQLSPAKN